MPNHRTISRCIAEVLENRTLLAATDLDPTFSADGVITSALNGGYNNARAVAVQSDGKVIIVGEAKLSKTSSTYGFAAVRYNTDGTLDDGGVNDSTPGDHFGTGGVFLYGQGTSSIPTSVAIGRDGKIVIAGYATNSTQQYWLLVRLNTDGSFDKTFNGSGALGMEFSTYNTPLTGVAIQSNGKIVAVGSENGDFLVGRFNVDGSEDDTFGNFGTVTTDFGGTDAATGVAIDNIGNIVVVGGAAGNGLTQKLGVTKYQPDGTPDPNFGSSGICLSTNTLRIDIGNVAITPDGVINVPYGYYSSFGSGSIWWSGVAKIGADGSPPSLGGSGYDKFTAIAAAPDGRYVTVGNYFGSTGTLNELEVSAYSSSKQPYVGSYARTAATAVAVAPDGSIYAAGTADVSGGRNFLLTKFQGIDVTAIGSVRGNVFRDLDGDGVRDPNEPGTPNVRVYEDINNDGVWTATRYGEPYDRSVLTDVNGNFTLADVDLTANLSVREIVPGGTHQTVPAKHAYVITAIAGKTLGGLNFVNAVTPVASTQTAITGNVFNDYNNDAARQTTGTIEPDMNNVVVYIDGNRNGKLDTGETYAKTDISGNYTLPLTKAGTWRVVVSPPRGYANTSPTYRDVLVHTHAQGIARFALTPLDTNDSLAEASPITLGRSVSGTITSATDVNVYSFTVKAGQTILFDLDLGKGSSLNSYLRLFDSRGTQLIANDNAAAPGETVSLDSYIKHFFNKSGTFYVAVSNHLNNAYNPLTGKGDLGGGSIGAYSLLARALA